ncbi:MAG: HNH endonuclease [Prevotella sp.]|nr:HNH endonuclease [Prevotella sp.]
MNENEKPIYDFAPLKNYLTSKGFVVGDRGAWKPIEPVTITIEDYRKGNVKFTDKGIFVIGKDGKEYQVFMYKKDYYMQRFGKPRFHICKCEVIQDFINRGLGDHYVGTNREPVPVINLDDNNETIDNNTTYCLVSSKYDDVIRAFADTWHKDSPYDLSSKSDLKALAIASVNLLAQGNKINLKPYGRKVMVENLPLCSKCRQMISECGTMNSTQFVDVLKAANGEDQELDIFGYTRDWERISLAYREAHDYTCEQCGLKIDNIYDKQYVHVHHKDGNKVNNDESNLQCLCLYCHAHVNEHHTQRLTTGANKIQYEDFVSEYKNVAHWDDNEGFSDNTDTDDLPF